MRVLDTNVLARFFVDDADDKEAARQRPAAIAALSERAHVPVTVLLEFEWLLRGFYRLPRAEVITVFRALSGIEHVSLEDRSAVLAAVDAAESGLDFADALHLLRTRDAGTFLTFDRRLAERATKMGLVPEVELLG